MASFFEKLKKGMGVEKPIEAEKSVKKEEKEITEEKPVERPKKKIRKVPGEKEEKQPIETKVEKTEKREIETKQEMPQKEEVEKIMPAEPAKKVKEEKENWTALSGEPEGQLAIDVYQTEESLVIQTAIAGVKPDSLDISIEGDMITIRGSREKPAETGERNYFYQECFWGPFSRQIVLSVEVDPSRTEAALKEGILTVRIPKIERERKRKIIVKG
ncbi:MAG: Hsp20/alpha crystallin family protein [Patescibacteria group bacterium]